MSYFLLISLQLINKLLDGVLNKFAFFVIIRDLIYVNTTCSTPEKMALTLLDYLFTRETLAVSNLSGKSKLGKKKLDPLMVSFVLYVWI